MARRYDSRTTIFSPEGRLYQVEYAMTAISNAGASIGILAKDGIVLAGEKKVTSKLLDQGRSSDKMYLIDDHVAASFSGITADSYVLLNQYRLAAQRYKFSYQEPMPLEQLVQGISDMKQGYTQYGGLRPLGCTELVAGYDKHFGFQLYLSDPAGNFSGWKATAVGNNANAAQALLKQEYSDSLTVKDALALATKVMAKTMDSTTLTEEKLEFAEITLDPNTKHGIKYRMLDSKELEALVKEHGTTPGSPR